MKRGERDDPKQGADVRENFAFGIGDAANGADVGAGQNLADLVADRGNVGRAEPAVIFGGSERLGIALGERIGGLGERADKKLAKFSAVVAGKRLGDGKRDEDGVVFGIARGDDAGDDGAEDWLAVRAVQRKLFSPAKCLRDIWRRNLRRRPPPQLVDG